MSDVKDRINLWSPLIHTIVLLSVLDMDYTMATW